MRAGQGVASTGRKEERFERSSGGVEETNCQERGR